MILYYLLLTIESCLSLNKPGKNLNNTTIFFVKKRQGRARGQKKSASTQEPPQ